jgi:hypothetical protein
LFANGADGGEGGAGGGGVGGGGEGVSILFHALGGPSVEAVPSARTNVAVQAVAFSNT